jgi:hypothetical protein
MSCLGADRQYYGGTLAHEWHGYLRSPKMVHKDNQTKFCKAVTLPTNGSDRAMDTPFLNEAR